MSINDNLIKFLQIYDEAKQTEKLNNEALDVIEDALNDTTAYNARGQIASQCDLDIGSEWELLAMGLDNSNVAGFIRVMKDAREFKKPLLNDSIEVIRALVKDGE
jgi:hypothetical protein